MSYTVHNHLNPIYTMLAVLCLVLRSSTESGAHTPTGVSLEPVARRGGATARAVSLVLHLHGQPAGGGTRLSQLAAGDLRNRRRGPGRAGRPRRRCTLGRRPRTWLLVSADQAQSWTAAQRTLRDLLRELDGLRDRVRSGLDGALDSRVGVGTGVSDGSGHLPRLDLDSRLLADVEGLLEQLDQAQLDGDVSGRAILV